MVKKIYRLNRTRVQRESDLPAHWRFRHMRKMGPRKSFVAIATGAKSELRRHQQAWNALEQGTGGSAAQLVRQPFAHAHPYLVTEFGHRFGKVRALSHAWKHQYGYPLPRVRTSGGAAPAAAPRRRAPRAPRALPDLSASRRPASLFQRLPVPPPLPRRLSQQQMAAVMSSSSSKRQLSPPTVVVVAPPRTRARRASPVVSTYGLRRRK